MEVFAIFIKHYFNKALTIGRDGLNPVNYTVGPGIGRAAPWPPIQTGEI